MKKKIIFISIILILVVGVDCIIGFFTNNAILKVNDIGVNQTNTVQAFFKRKADVLILGPSTANHHYNCKIIEDKLKMTCFNAGRDGQNIIYNAMVLEGFLTRCTPRLVVLDITNSSLSDTWMSSLDELNCYYGFLKPIDNIIDSIGGVWDKYKRFSNIYRYNKTWEWLLKARITKPSEDMNGYKPLEVKKVKGLYASVEEREFVSNELCLKYMNLIISKCREKGIFLIFVISPSLVVDKGIFANEVEKLIKNQHVFCLNWNGDTAYTNHPELFYDKTHLNADGANRYTLEFVQRVNCLLDKSS